MLSGNAREQKAADGFVSFSEIRGSPVDARTGKSGLSSAKNRYAELDVEDDGEDGDLIDAFDALDFDGTSGNDSKEGTFVTAESHFDVAMQVIVSVEGFTRCAIPSRRCGWNTELASWI